MNRAPRLLLALASIGTAACSGLDPGVDYPGDLPSASSVLVTPEGDASGSVGLDRLGEFKVSAAACEGVDVRPMTQPLTQDDLGRFLEERAGVKLEPKKARGNLYWYDFPSADKDVPLRLRVAVLSDSGGAAADLMAALHEHGPGWWGLRRSNLAVLAPKTSLSTAVDFAVKYKLFCWGMVTVAGNDDNYVVPGPYAEL